MEQRQLFCLVDETKSLTITATAATAFNPQHLEWLNSFAAGFTFADTA